MAIIIRTAEDFARALSKPSDPTLQPLLQAHADRLAEYPDYSFEDLAMFLIVEAGDDQDSINEAIGWPLLDSEGTFSHPVELIALHDNWIEGTFILSDDGFGMIMLVPIDEGTDRKLLAACKRALVEAQQAAFPYT